jgi:hypothetical protein
LARKSNHPIRSELSLLENNTFLVIMVAHSTKSSILMATSSTPNTHWSNVAVDMLPPMNLAFDTHPYVFSRLIFNANCHDIIVEVIDPEDQVP